MTKEEIIRNLKYTMKKHKNDIVNTFDTNISVMCKDILDYFEEQEPCEDAISREAFIKRYDEWMYSEYGKHCEKDALAIRVANSLPSVTPKPIECGDAISREAVLSKIKEVCFSKEWVQFRIDNGSNGQRDLIIDYIKQLPPVTPKPIECEDAISREDVIKLVECSGYDLQFRTDNADMCNDVRKLSPVTPSRRKGHWIKVGGMSYVNDKYQCSECGEIITEMPVCMTEPLYKGCPYCLAEMESE